MAAMTGTEASGTVQTCDIALEAVGREVFDRLTIEVDPPLNAQLERAAFYARISRVWGIKTAILPSIQSRSGTASVAPFDIAVERGDCTLACYVKSPAPKGRGFSAGSSRKG